MSWCIVSARGDGSKRPSKRGASWVAESPVPDIGRDGGVGVEAAVERGHTDAVQVTGGVTSEDHPPGSLVLDRKTEIVKVDINRVITTESFNRDEVFD